MNITNDKLMEILERNLGLPMGDGGIFYIEDPGQKRINKIYFSKNDMSLYKCTADNTDVTVTGNFKLYSLSNTDDYLGALTGVDRGQVKYIQDVGTKYVDKVYIDRPTGKLYRCVTQTSSVNNDANFVENNLSAISALSQNIKVLYNKYFNITIVLIHVGYEVLDFHIYMPHSNRSIRFEEYILINPEINDLITGFNCGFTKIYNIIGMTDDTDTPASIGISEGVMTCSVRLYSAYGVNTNRAV